jgi:cobalt/nickel transport system permease protein
MVVVREGYRVHIPDGYLGPQTYVPAYVVMAGFWASAIAKLKKTLRNRQVPMLALSAAFTFLIMMFNVPIPGGTTGHAVGGVLVAVLLGPWAAMVAVSLALILQALLFGDGGITALGANCLNMAVIMPFTGWGVYRLISGKAPASSRLHAIAGAAGGYVGLNAAALSAAVMFGIQPLLAHDAAGHALYSPFGLKVAIPAMAVEHLLVFGVVEGLVTGLVIAYFQRTSPELIPTRERTSTDAGVPLERRLIRALTVLAILTPLGLYLPARFGSGSAWGEWSAQQIGKMAGYVPSGLAGAEGRWHSVLPDYALPGQKSAPLLALSLSYIVSAFVGIGLLWLLSAVAGKLMRGKERDGCDTGVAGASGRR